MKDKELRRMLWESGYYRLSGVGIKLYRDTSMVSEQVDRVAYGLDRLVRELTRDGVVYRPCSGGVYRESVAETQQKIDALAEALGYEFTEEPAKPERIIAKRKPTQRKRQ